MPPKLPTTDIGSTVFDPRETLKRGENVFLQVVNSLANLEAKAFLFETGRLPVDPFSTGSGVIVADPQVQLEEFIAETILSGELLLRVLDLYPRVKCQLTRVHQTPGCPAATGPVTFRDHSAQCYATIAGDLLLQFLGRAPPWIVEDNELTLVRAFIAEAMEDGKWPISMESSDALSFVYDFDWQQLIVSVIASARAAYNRPDTSWHFHQLYAWVEWEFSCARTTRGSPDAIPPEDRTIPMSYRRAAKLMGKGDSKDAAEWLSASVSDGSIRCEHISRQLHVFCLREFPESVHHLLLPPGSRPTDSKSP